MRRTLILIPALLVLLAGTFLVYFSTSDMNVSGQSYFASLSDFVFMARSYVRGGLGRRLPLNDRTYEAVVVRFREKGHWEVKKRAVHELVGWGDAVVPRLLAELEADGDGRSREGAVQALGEIGDPRAVEPLGNLLLLSRDDSAPERRLQVALVDALGDLGIPEGGRYLERFLHTGSESVLRLRHELWDALAETGCCTDVLLAELGRSDDPEHIHSLLWPLAITRDPRAARVLAEYLKHPVYKIRQRSRDAMDQSMGPVAVDPVLDVLLTVQDDFVRSAILGMVLDDGDARGNPRTVPAVAGFLGHPVLDGEARHALARMGGDEAVAALAEDAKGRDPRTVMEHVDALGEDAVDLVAGYLSHHDPYVRRRAVEEMMELRVPGAGEFLTPLLSDGDHWVRRDAAAVLLSQDRVDLFWTFTRALPERLGRSAWHGFRPPYRRGFRALLEVFTVVHWAGLAFSLLLGIVLVLGLWRVLEPFRFNLFVQFLLVEGFVGDFFLMDGGSDPRRLFLNATGVRLFLLAGFLFTERDRVPGELRSRFERLGGASLWILAPLLLYAGTPALARGLRLAFSDFETMLPALVLLAVLTAFVLEQWVLPWNLFPRPAWADRLLSGLLTAATLAIPVQALVLDALHRHPGGEFTGPSLLLLAPLGWMLLLHLHAIDLFRKPVPRLTTATPPTPRLEAVQDGDRLSVRVRRARTRWGVLRAAGMKVAFGFAAGGWAGYVAGSRDGGGPSMMLAMMIAVLGAAVAGVVMDVLAPRVLLQFRAGHARTAAAVLGGTLTGGRWSGRITLTRALAGRIRGLRPGGGGGGGPPFDAAERKWLEQLMSGTAGRLGGGAR